MGLRVSGKGEGLERRSPPSHGVHQKAGRDLSRPAGGQDRTAYRSGARTHGGHGDQQRPEGERGHGPQQTRERRYLWRANAQNGNVLDRETRDAHTVHNHRAHQRQTP